jgi:uncharacterized protein (DUF427 family)
VEQGAKRVRAYLGDELVADTIRPRLVWEAPYYPAYYFPLADVRTDLLVATATVTHSPSRGQAQHFTIKAGGKAAEDTALRYADSPDPRAPRPHAAGLGRDGRLIRGGRGGLHPPRDPYTRVDITPKTASIHVSRILAKLGVAGRGEAAAIAHRLGLDQR